MASNFESGLVGSFTQCLRCHDFKSQPYIGFTYARRDKPKGERRRIGWFLKSSTKQDSVPIPVSLLSSPQLFNICAPCSPTSACLNLTNPACSHTNPLFLGVTSTTSRYERSAKRFHLADPVLQGKPWRQTLLGFRRWLERCGTRRVFRYENALTPWSHVSETEKAMRRKKESSDGGSGDMR